MTDAFEGFQLSEVFQGSDTSQGFEPPEGSGVFHPLASAAFDVAAVRAACPARCDATGYPDGAAAAGVPVAEVRR